MTFGENIGTLYSPVPPLPRLRSRTRQPILLDLWSSQAPPRRTVTTVANWRQKDFGIVFQGEEYLWSKHHEFLRVLDLPRRVSLPLELAMGLTERPVYDQHGNEAVPSFGLDEADKARLIEHGWRLTDSRTFSRDPWSYRAYIRHSFAEFTVARISMSASTRAGSASGARAISPQVDRLLRRTPDLGPSFQRGKGFSLISTMDEAAAALETIESDYAHQSPGRAVNRTPMVPRRVRVGIAARRSGCDVGACANRHRERRRLRLLRLGQSGRHRGPCVGHRHQRQFDDPSARHGRGDDSEPRTSTAQPRSAPRPGRWTFVDGTWEPRYQVVPIGDEAAVREESRRQLTIFRELVGDGSVALGCAPARSPEGARDVGDGRYG